MQADRIMLERQDVPAVGAPATSISDGGKIAARLRNARPAAPGTSRLDKIKRVFFYIVYKLRVRMCSEKVAMPLRIKRRLGKEEQAIRNIVSLYGQEGWNAHLCEREATMLKKVSTKIEEMMGSESFRAYEHAFFQQISPSSEVDDSDELTIDNSDELKNMCRLMQAPYQRMTLVSRNELFENTNDSKNYLDRMCTSITQITSAAALGEFWFLNNHFVPQGPAAILLHVAIEITQDFTKSLACQTILATTENVKRLLYCIDRLKRIPDGIYLHDKTHPTLRNLLEQTSQVVFAVQEKILPMIIKDSMSLVQADQAKSTWLLESLVTNLPQDRNILELVELLAPKFKNEVVGRPLQSLNSTIERLVPQPSAAVKNQRLCIFSSALRLYLYKDWIDQFGLLSDKEKTRELKKMRLNINEKIKLLEAEIYSQRLG